MTWWREQQKRNFYATEVFLLKHLFTGFIEHSTTLHVWHFLTIFHLCYASSPFPEASWFVLSQLWAGGWESYKTQTNIQVNVDGLDLSNFGQAFHKNRPTIFFWFIYNFLNDHICKGLVFHRLFLVWFFWLRQPARMEWKKREKYTLLLLYNLLIYKKACFY